MSVACVLGHALARMLAQGVGHFVAHDHGDFVVGELELVQDAGVEGDLAAGHAKGVDLLAADQVDLPLPAASAVVPLAGDTGSAAPQWRAGAAAGGGCRAPAHAWRAPRPASAHTAGRQSAPARRRAPACAGSRRTHLHLGQHGRGGAAAPPPAERRGAAPTGSGRRGRAGQTGSLGVRQIQHMMGVNNSQNEAFVCPQRQPCWFKVTRCTLIALNRLCPMPDTPRRPRRNPPPAPRSWLEALRVYLEPSSLRMLTLGFSAGLPLLLVLGTLSFRLREAGIDRSTIGYLSWVGWPMASSGSGRRWWTACRCRC
jgi:hypothetical protein